MKRVYIFLSVLFLIGLVSASVNVNNYSVKKTYSPFENISGEINLTIVGENYSEKIVSNDGDEISLANFLKNNGVIFNCSPPDCSEDYSFSGDDVGKDFSVPSSGYTYAGFVIGGQNVVIENLSFVVDSNFEKSYRSPLNIGFFGEDIWSFKNFSDTLLGKEWGCYNFSFGSVGPQIGADPYCEMIRVEDTNALNVGAFVNGSDSSPLVMKVYPKDGFDSWSCEYNPDSQDGCRINATSGQLFSGDYEVCVGSKTPISSYRIYNESVGDNCGFSYGGSVEDSKKDYSIFAQRVKYSSGESVGPIKFNQAGLVDDANDFITNKYLGDCSSGCVLPLKIFGVGQMLHIYNVSIAFTKDSEYDSSDKVYRLEKKPATVDYEGIVDLGALGFNVSKSMEYSLSLGGKRLFKEDIVVFPAPTVSSIFPMHPAAGLTTNFFATINYNKNKSLTYSWDFGDGKKETTDIPRVSHLYSEMGNYTLSLEVSAGGNLTSTRTFNIKVVNPERAINEGLILKRLSLKDIESQIDSFPSWYGDSLSELLELDSIKDSLDEIDGERNDSRTDSDFIKVAKKLNVLHVPSKIVINTLTSSGLPTALSDIDVDSIESLVGVANGSNSEYASAILYWQNKNIVVNFVNKNFIVFYDNGESDPLFSLYSMNVNSNSPDESFFIIDKPFKDLHFNGDVGAEKVGDVISINLPSSGKKSFEFYYDSGEPPTFFISPKLSHIVLKKDVDSSCNHNGVCDDGENSSNCRGDCKPFGKMIVYWVLLFFLALAIYTIFQVWYKHHYESYLFNDRKQMYNILMYVTNERTQGIRDDRIAAELRSKGWSSERVNYIIKKSAGKRMGLVEIIPTGKISAFFRNRKVKKNQSKGIATGLRQQSGRKINKYSFRRR